MSTHSNAGEFFGSVADDLLLDARCPVVVVPRGAQLQRRATAPLKVVD